MLSLKNNSDSIYDMGFWSFMRKYESYKSKVSLWSVRCIYQNLAGPITYLFIKARVSPNTITFLSLFSFIVGCAFFIEQTYLITAFFWVFSYVLDCSDGAVPRATGKGTRFGAFFDVIVDRVVSVLFLALIVFSLNPTLEGVIITLGLSSIVSYAIMSSMRPFYYPELKGYANSSDSGIIFKLAKLVYETLDTGNLLLLTCVFFYFGLEVFLFGFYFFLCTSLFLFNLRLAYKLN